MEKIQTCFRAIPAQVTEVPRLFFLFYRDQALLMESQGGGAGVAGEG